SADWVWQLGDIANASMAFPNLIAIAALSGVVVAMHRDPNGGAVNEEGASAPAKPAAEG
ncbi:MAG: alanine:cation symporter family protein, partial [Pseudomonadota bacterium]